jgi:hypothetical protein
MHTLRDQNILKFLPNLKVYYGSRIWDASWFVALILGILYLSSVLVRFYWSSYLPGPVVMIDELMYKAAAESFFRFRDFNKLYASYRPIQGNILYQSIISFSFYFGERFYIVSKAINVAVISAAIFPTFLIAKCFIQGKLPLLAVIMTMLIPANLYANYILTENLFFPLFLFSFFFIFRSICWSRYEDAMAGGLSVALLFLTKPHAIAIIVALILVIMILMIFSKHFSVSISSIGKSFSVMVVSMIICYIVMVILLKGRISPSEIFGWYGYFGWGILTKPVKIVESLGSLLRMTVGHLTGFLFIYSVPVVVVMISIVQSFKNKDYKSFVFLLWGSMIFLACFAMTLKFSSDVRESEHIINLHARYYFFVFPFFLTAFIGFLKKVDRSIPNAAAFLLTSAFVGVAMTTVFPVFFPSLGFLSDFLEWAWLNTFFPAYRSVIDPHGWNWWGAENLKIASMILMVLAFLLGLYYGLTKVRYLYPYLIFFVLFSIVGNIFTLRSQIGLSNIGWQKTRTFLTVIEDTITDPKDSVMLIGSWSGVDMQLVFWLSYENFDAVLLAPGAYVTDNIISSRTKWVILLDQYNITAQMQLIRSDEAMNIYRVPEADEHRPF